MTTVAADALSSDRTRSITIAPALAVAALASIGAGAIHAAAIGVHSEHRQAVIAFTVVAAIQIGFGVLALSFANRIIAVLGALANAAFIGGWVLAKTNGISFIAGLDVAEDIQTADVIAASLAGVAVLGVLFALRSGMRPSALGGTTLAIAALVTALIALLAGLVIAAGRSARGAAVRLLALLAGWTAVALAAFFARGAILPWAGPVLGAIVAYGAAGAGSWLTEGRRHRETKRAFGKFVPPGVVETIAADPRLRHRVERREITVLFADVRGFTSIAEREGAERTVETLNELFSAMVDAVFRHGGTLDKFLGDGLLAFFGAPLPQPDHAARACRAAIEMLDRLERLNAQWTASARPTLAMGIGIHSGPAVVGFVGDPERRLDYTAIGDTVNLASRLQVQTKELHERIIVSAATARQAGDAFPFRDLGETRVRGRAEPVTVLALEAGGAPS